MSQTWYVYAVIKSSPPPNETGAHFTLILQMMKLRLSKELTQRHKQ